MVKCALCRGRVALTKQLCNDCHVFKELMTRFGKDQVIVRVGRVHVCVGRACKRIHRGVPLPGRGRHIGAPRWHLPSLLRGMCARAHTITFDSLRTIANNARALSARALIVRQTSLCRGRVNVKANPQVRQTLTCTRNITPQDQLPNLVQGLKEASVGVRSHDLTVGSGHQPSILMQRDSHQQLMPCMGLLRARAREKSCFSISSFGKSCA